MNQRFINYCTSNCAGQLEDRSLAEIFGTESFCWFLYSLIRMEMPSTVVELGVGAGVTTIAAALALKENDHGVIWALDDGSTWERLGKYYRHAAEGFAGAQTYEEFFRRLVAYFDVRDRVQLISKTLAAREYFAPNKSIDLVFIDLGDTSATGCVSILKYYLPRMSEHSSIFIDRSSTIWDAYLYLEAVVSSLNSGNIPLHLLHESDHEENTKLESLVKSSRFNVTHLVDRNPLKWNRLQNGRCWLQIRPFDVVPDSTVQVSQFSR